MLYLRFLTLDRKLSEEVTIDLMYLVIAILSMAGLIIVHELIHGIFLSCSIRKEKSNLVLRMVWPMQQVLIPFIQGGSFYLFCFAPFCLDHFGLMAVVCV